MYSSRYETNNLNETIPKLTQNKIINPTPTHPKRITIVIITRSKRPRIKTTKHQFLGAVFTNRSHYQLLTLAMKQLSEVGLTGHAWGGSH